ncbi:aminopeptidase PepB [Biostraticola tofi]|uniref:PepB aminopeptidase n=1 Tax=Biostraticola tofi TaxID=466109 RepID=A0A4R3YLC0_9GAMM|nr:aminopeptidase PepB [Biostraticola tofi]TCV92228.1 PepB aminopeptidase [Biostraticola tofi]
MTTEAMQVMLSSVPADARWGDKALLSVNDLGISIHLTSDNSLDDVQRAARKIDGQGVKHVSLSGDGWDLEHCWSFWQGYRGPKGSREVNWPELSAADRKELDDRLKIIDWVRHTINTPAEELGPEQLAMRAVDIMHTVADEAISYRITKAEDLREKNYMGLHTVGRGSDRQPVMLSLDYNPSGNPDEPVLACLVGKGITFDTGGYSLKGSSSMDSMKSDMGGAATVTGALALAIARGLNQRVRLYLCCADNMVSGNAFKLGDIIRYRNGKSVEVMNTDAEGRLVLADGLIDAAARQPRIIIDCATLTGAAKTALGNDFHALFSFDDALSGALLESAEQENEPFWRLPLAEFHRRQLPSSFADLSNVAGAANTAGASTAAAFLSHFVENYRQGWLHIDCSATYRKGAVEQWSAGATGLGVRTLANLLLAQAGK